MKEHNIDLKAVDQEILGTPEEKQSEKK